uniref:(northern house mosquito) hypothetical protein n=1 Tax=Culex pipiens TaxID=7175 RepID=A0A8D8A2Y7_CULPI
MINLPDKLDQPELQALLQVFLQRIVKHEPLPAGRALFLFEIFRQVKRDVVLFEHLQLHHVVLFEGLLAVVEEAAQATSGGGVGGRNCVWGCGLKSTPFRFVHLSPLLVQIVLLLASLLLLRPPIPIEQQRLHQLLLVQVLLKGHRPPIRPRRHHPLANVVHFRSYHRRLYHDRFDRIVQVLFGGTIVRLSCDQIPGGQQCGHIVDGLPPERVRVLEVGNAHDTNLLRQAVHLARI